jgi:hypothetical protein
MSGDIVMGIAIPSSQSTGWLVAKKIASPIALADYFFLRPMLKTDNNRQQGLILRIMVQTSARLSM